MNNDVGYWVESILYHVTCLSVPILLITVSEIDAAPGSVGFRFVCFE